MAAASPIRARPGRTSAICSARSSASTWTRKKAVTLITFRWTIQFVSSTRALAAKCGPTEFASAGRSVSGQRAAICGRAEVGQDLWEQIYKIKKGGNYGWSVNEEANYHARAEGVKGPTPILAAALSSMADTEFRSLTGGYIYHGKNWPALEGLHLRRLRHWPCLDDALRSDGQEGH